MTANLWEEIKSSIPECDSNIEAFKLDSDEVRNYMQCSPSVCDYLVRITQGRAEYLIFVEHTDLIQSFRRLELSGKLRREIQKCLHRAGLPNHVRQRLTDMLPEFAEISVAKEMRNKLCGSLLAINALGVRLSQNTRVCFVLCYPLSGNEEIIALDNFISQLVNDLRNSLCVNKIQIIQEGNLQRALEDIVK